MTTKPTTDQPGIAIALGEPETTRRLRALQMGEARNWWIILPSPNPSDKPSEIVFRVRMAHDRKIRRMSGAEILTWVQGFADAHGVGDEFTYREGQ